MKLFLKILWFIFILLLVLAVLWAAFWMVFIKDWPYWTGGSVILGSLGLVAIYFFLKKVFIRRREKKYVQQVIDQEKRLVDVAGDNKLERLNTLERHWQESVGILKQSHLQKEGNPLYVLPWYMLLGSQGAGKTSAIRSARLSTPFPEIPQPAGSGTRYCDWWFTEQAIFLDTAGRYSSPVMDGVDQDEWQRLLALLLKARKKEPLNGIVVAVAADRLLEGNGDEFEEEGRAIRLRIDELMRVLGAKMPVYILVTKCDQIYGMDHISENVPDSFFDQPMGVINEDFEKPHAEFIEEALLKTAERLKDLRFLLLYKRDGEKTGIMLLPEEFMKLKPALQGFMRGVFRINPYQETPLMRGIFFSSAEQSGTPVSNFVEQLGPHEEPPAAAEPQQKAECAFPAVQKACSEVLLMDVLPDTKRGMFLHDFFDWVLTTDRTLYRPHRESIRRFRSTWGFGMFAWLAVLGATLGLVSTSYMLNRYTLNEYLREFNSPAYLTNNLLDNILVMDRLRSVIIKMDERNQRWWVPRLGLEQSREAVIKLKQDYCALFRKYFFDNLNSKMEANVLKMTPDTPGEERGAYISNMVNRILFMNARLEGWDFAHLATLPKPSGAALMILDPRVTPDVAARYQDLYLYYSAWQTDNAPIFVAKQKLLVLLGRILTGNTGQYDFKWLLEWVNKTEDSSRITLNAFWKGSGAIADPPSIQPCFTLKGKERVDEFLSQIRRVYPPSDSFDQQMKRFREEYGMQYVSAWNSFAIRFSDGISLLDGITEWRDEGNEMATAKSPVQLFLDRLILEVKPFAEGSKVPEWYKLAVEHQKIRQQGEEDAFAKQAAGLSQSAGSVISKGKQIFDAFKTKSTALLDQNAAREQMEMVKAYQELAKSLSEMSKTINTRNTATRLASDIFSGGATAFEPAAEAAGAKNALFNQTYNSLINYRTRLKRIGNDEVFWNVMESPLDFFVALAAKEAGCSLQKAWESQVLAEAGAATETTKQQILFGEKGAVWKFVTGPAAPFITSRPQGYAANVVMGRSVQFEPAFFDFLTRGSVGKQKIQDSYAVRIKAYPIHVNTDAFQKPVSAELALSCGDDLQSLNNMNYQVQKVFKWSPKSCGETRLRIKFNSLVIEKRYPGNRGFINFLTDFKNGERILTPADFPEKWSSLSGMNVREIRLRYHFSGNAELLALPEYYMYDAPPVIAACKE